MKSCAGASCADILRYPVAESVKKTEPPYRPRRGQVFWSLLAQPPPLLLETLCCASIVIGKTQRVVAGAASAGRRGGSSRPSSF